MRRRVEDWSVEKLHKARTRISFPEYQRQPNLWSVEKKRLLIDSILRDIDIPKLYFNETKDNSIEVIDGTQRLWSIWEFIDNQFEYAPDGEPHTFVRLSPAQQQTIKAYELQVTILEDAADEYLRELFVRLQLGLLLVTGEKLNAATGMMKEFVFNTLSKHKMIGDLTMPNRRFAKETLCAQISINSFRRAKVHTFARTRYDDLSFFFQEYEKPEGGDMEFFLGQSQLIVSVLDQMSTCFGAGTKELSNRSYILSIYLLFEELRRQITRPSAQKEFVEFVFLLWKRLREEIGAGIDRGNRELYSFETMLSSAPGEKYQIERRHHKLLEYFAHYKKTGTIVGD